MRERERLCIGVYVCIHVHIYIYICRERLFIFLWDVDYNSPDPPQLLTDAPPIVIGCPPSPLVGSKCTMYAYTYIFGACGGQFLGFIN